MVIINNLLEYFLHNQNTIQFLNTGKMPIKNFQKKNKLKNMPFSKPAKLIFSLEAYKVFYII